MSEMKPPLAALHGLGESSPWVRQWAHLVVPGGAVLDVASGAGRHARFFASRGHPVTALDRDTTALAALHGEVVPQSVKLPLAIVEDPDFKDGVNYYSDQSDNFFVGNAFPTCGINFTAQQIMGQSEKND